MSIPLTPSLANFCQSDRLWSVRSVPLPVLGMGCDTPKSRSDTGPPETSGVWRTHHRRFSGSPVGKGRADVRGYDPVVSPSPSTEVGVLFRSVPSPRPHPPLLVSDGPPVGDRRCGDPPVSNRQFLDNTEQSFYLFTRVIKK